MFTQSVSLAKTRDMESQNELYSFFGDRLGGGGHINVMRRGREVEAGRFYFLQTIFNTPSKRAIPFPFQITKISFCERTVKIKQWYSINM